MSRASVIFVLTWKAIKKDNVYAARRSRNPRIKFQVNSIQKVIFVFES